MKVYSDIFTNDELMSDSYPQLAPFEDEALGCVGFEVKSRFITKKDEDYGISANQDENGEEGGIPSSNNAENVIDIVDKFSLQEQYVDKKAFMVYIKKYFKNICDHLEQNTPGRLDIFKSNGASLVKKILLSFDDCNIYIGENSSDGFAEFKAHPIVARYVGEESTPRFLFFSDGLLEEKC